MSSLCLAIFPLWIAWSEKFPGVWLGVLGILWSCLVFAPIAHWVWGDGWLADLGTIDFGGGLLVIAVACSGFRVNPKDVERIVADASDLRPHQGLGAMLLWLGAALFISAQTFHADGRAALALLNVLLGTSAGIMVWCFSNGFVWKAPALDALVVNVAAAVMGMAPLAGFVQPQSAIIIGALVGFLANVWFHFGLRDRTATRSLYFSTMGVAAAVGMLCAGVFATTSVAVARWDGRPVYGFIEGEPRQLLHQIVGVGSAAAWAFIVTRLLHYAVGQCQSRFAGTASAAADHASTPS